MTHMDPTTAGREAVKFLQDLIRINTTNPPGNEIEAVRYVSAILDREGIPYQIFEPATGRANLIARLQGNGKRKPLLLTSHLDVVPAEPDKWLVDPFSGVEKDGCIWGRGAVDMKQMTAMTLAILLHHKRSGQKLDRDILFAAVADEEAGCDYGSKWLVENKRELLDAEYGLNEGGAFSLHIDGNVFYPIGVAEKGLCWFDITAQGDPGHGSMPHDNQAVVKIAEATARLGNEGLPYHLHPLVGNFIATLAKYQKAPKGLFLKSLLVPWLADFVLKKIFPDRVKARQFYAILHNTVSPTILSGGSKVNVIPSKASVKVDGRIIPGQSIDSFLTEVKKIIGDDFKVDVMQGHEPSTVDYGNDFFELLKTTIKKHDADAIPIPYLIPGFTDAAFYHRIGIKTYGFAPVKLPPNMNFSEMFHGHNERIPVDGFLWGLKVLGDVVSLC